MQDAERKRICYFVKDVYSEKRLHSLLAYCPPNEFEERLLDKRELTIPYSGHPNLICPTMGVHPPPMR